MSLDKRILELGKFTHIEYNLAGKNSKIISDIVRTEYSDINKKNSEYHHFDSFHLKDSIIISLKSHLGFFTFKCFENGTIMYHKEIYNEEKGEIFEKFKTIPNDDELKKLIKSFK